MIPLDITPISAPTATNSNSMGSLAEMLADIAFRNKKLAEDARQADMANAISQSATEGKNRYYDLEGDTHRMVAEDRATARKEKDDSAANKRLDFLRDAYRKAPTAAERKSILDQIRSHAASMGLSFDEMPGDNSATNVAPEDTGSSVPAGAKPGFSPFLGPKGKPMKAPGVNPTFAANLAAYMQGPDASASPPETTDAGAPGDAGVSVSPFPWDKLGLPSPPAAPPTAQSQGGSGRFALKDKSGNLMQMWDESSRDSDTKAAIAAGMKSQPGDSPEERKAAAAAVQEASAFAPQIGTEKAIQFADAKYKAILQEYKKQPAEAQKGVGGPGGPSKVDIKLTAREDDLTNKIIARTARDDEVKAMHRGIAMAQRAKASLDSGSGMGDLDAFKSYLLEMSGKVVTDKEMDQFMHSEGAWVGWEKKAREYTAAGRFPEEFTRPLAAMMSRFESLNAGRLQQLGTGAKEEARLSDLSPAAQAIVYGHFTGNFGDAAPQSVFGGKTGSKPAGKPGGNSRLQQLLGSE